MSSALHSKQFKPSDAPESIETRNFVSKTIVFAPNDLSRAIESLSFIAQLAKRSPNDRIDVVANVKTAALFEHFSVVHKVWRFDLIESSKRPELLIDSLNDWLNDVTANWTEKIALAKQVAQQQYDRAIFLDHSHYKPLMTMLVGIRARWGFGPHWPLTLTRTLNLVSEQNTGSPRLAQWLELVDLGKRGSDQNVDEQRASLPLLSRPSMEPSYARRKFGVSALMPVLIFVAGHNRFMPPGHKDWPNRYWFELSQQVQERFGQVQIVFIGDIVDRSRATEIATLIGPLAHNLCGMTSLYETMALMTSALSVVGNDHLMLHLSSALGVPNVGIFGGTDPRSRAPKSAQHRTLWLHLECSPCQGPTCQLGRAVCLERLTPRDALNALELNHVNTQLL
jgi:heptosyltransferase II